MVQEKRSPKWSFKYKFRSKYDVLRFIPLLSIILFFSNQLYLHTLPQTGFNPIQLSNRQEPFSCALLFFGLPKHFNRIVFPSIERHILNTNPGCDIFVHTYNLTQVTNTRNQERDVAIHPMEVYQLNATETMITSIEEFYRKRDIKYYNQYHFVKWGPCCVSTENMIKQWHSIESVWNLMKDYRKRNNQGLYDKVGLFRLDVEYQNDIYMRNGDAVIPNFAHHKGLNDRLFYGSFQYAEVWASKRFDYVKEFVESRYSLLRDSNGPSLHSETFLKALLKRYKVPYKLENICFYRVRGHGEIRKKDCDD